MPEAPVKKQRKTRHITDEMLEAAAILVANNFSIMRTAALLHVGRSSLSRRLKQRAANARRGTAAGRKSSKKAAATATVTEAGAATTKTAPPAHPVSVIAEAIADPAPSVVAAVNATS